MHCMQTNVMQSDIGKESCLTLRHNIIAKISAEYAFRICKKIVNCHFYKGNCSQIEKDFLLSNTYNYVIHTFTLFGKFLKILQPIVAGYNWIFDSSINKFIIQSDDMLSLIIIGFWLQHQYSSGHFLFEFNNKFYSILNDIWAWLNSSSLTSGFCLQLIWEFIHKHSSGWYDEKYPKTMFGVSECHSKCTVHLWIIGIGIIQ